MESFSVLMGHTLAQLQTRFKDAFVWMYCDFTENGAPLAQVYHKICRLTDPGKRCVLEAQHNIITTSLATYRVSRPDTVTCWQMHGPSESPK